MAYEEGDIVLCTVDKIEKTMVFVKIDGGGDGTIILSEIAPGRIRNIRDYVVPKKQIVCKILRMDSSDNIHLSLRRVSQKEEKEVKERHNEEKSYKNILQGLLRDKAGKVIEKILETSSLYEFFQDAREDSKIFEKLVGKTEADKILKILKEQKTRIFELKKEFSLSTTNPEGIKQIKELLGKIKDAEIKYISAGKYLIKAESENIKTADNKIKSVLKEISEQAENRKMNFQINEK